MSANTFKPCVIHVGGNKALSEAVEFALKSRGYYVSDVAHTYSHYGVGPGRTVAGDDGQWGQEQEYPRFDAATQFGALLEYLDKPEEKQLTNKELGALVGLLIEVARMPNTEYVADDHNKAVRELKRHYAASRAARKEAR